MAEKKARIQELENSREATRLSTESESVRQPEAAASCPKAMDSIASDAWVFLVAECIGKANFPW